MRVCMVFQNCEIRFLQVRLGLPQGSLFDSVLLFLFINEFAASLSSSVSSSFYADDLVIWSSYFFTVPVTVRAT